MSRRRTTHCLSSARVMGTMVVELLAVVELVVLPVTIVVPLLAKATVASWRVTTSRTEPSASRREEREPAGSAQTTSKTARTKRRKKQTGSDMVSLWGLACKGKEAG